MKATGSAAAAAEPMESASESGMMMKPDPTSMSHDEDPVLAAVKRAPLVPMTDEERILMEELESQPIRWTPHEQFMSRLRMLNR